MRHCARSLPFRLKSSPPSPFHRRITMTSGWPGSTTPQRLSRRGFLASTAAIAAAAALPRGASSARAIAPLGCDRLAAIVAQWDRAVRPMLSSRYHRLQHCLFHYVRNNWPRLTAAQRDAITALDWATPRASMEGAEWDRDLPYRNIFWAAENGSGEDFLYY